MAMTTRDIDPVTLEVVRNRFESIVREMGDITLRTARSAVVYSGRDFSCGLLTHEAELLAVGTSVPVHIFPTLWQVQKCLSRFENDVHPGDIFIGNDPYDGGTHLNDVLIFMPVFEGGDLVAFAANRSHWYDVGGMVPGSLSGSSREIYQEGLRIPPIRIGQQHQLNPDVLDLILLNVRRPDETRGDIMAQVASCRIAGQHIQHLIQRYGKSCILDCTAEILDAADRRMRACIANLPNDSATHEGYMDNDGVQPEHRRIQVTVTCEGETLHVDYTGTAPQSQGPLNVGLALAHCFAFMGVKAALDPKGPINSGAFRPIRVTVPEVTMLNAKAPAPAGGMAEVGQAAVYTMVAVSLLHPDTTLAEEGAGANHQNLSGHDMRSADPHAFIYYDYPSGGSGASAQRDGLDFVRSIRSGNVNAQSIEVLEHLFPLMFHRHELRQDSGGPGRFRGGMGVVRAYEMPSAGAFSVLTDHALVPAAGLQGGESGAPTRWEVVRRESTQPVSPTFGSKVTAFPLEADDVIHIATQGGGGYGDPLEREPHRVQGDVLDGKISRTQAHNIYGVVLDAETLQFDAAATTERRAALAAQRLLLVPQRGGRPVFEQGMRVAWFHVGIETQGLGAGMVVEVIAPAHPAPLRVHVCYDTSVAPQAIRLDQEVWERLSLNPTDPLVIRPLGRTVTSS